MYTTSGVWEDWMYGNRSSLALTCEIYQNDSAWEYELGPYPNSLWERGITQAFNPEPRNIETTIQQWLPVFTYTTERATRLLGETNGDGKVDLKDVFRVGKAFGSVPGQPKWDAFCDINVDFKVDLKDYFTTCKNFGKTNP